MRLQKLPIATITVAVFLVFGLLLYSVYQHIQKTRSVPAIIHVDVLVSKSAEEIDRVFGQPTSSTDRFRNYETSDFESISVGFQDGQAISFMFHFKKGYTSPEQALQVIGIDVRSQKSAEEGRIGKRWDNVQSNGVLFHSVRSTYDHDWNVAQVD